MYFMENGRFSDLAEIVFPSSIYCICCGKFVDKNVPYSICDFCRERMGFGHIYIDLKRVEKHLASEMYIDSARSCVWYGAFTRVLVEDYKDLNKTYLARTMAELLWERLATDPSALGLLDCDYVIPAPISEGSKRGFNQSEKMAKYFCEHAGLELLDCLTKGGGRTSQRRLNAAGRMMKLRGSIEVNEETDSSGVLKDKSVIVLDDVFTTGATVNECARALKEAGVRTVHGLTFATKNQYAFGRFSD